MDLAEATAGDRLWGWPVGVLDQLLALQRGAWAGAVSIEQWRAQDAELCGGLPEVDADEVGDALTEWVTNGSLNLGEHAGLLGRLTVLANRPPTDDELWAQLAEMLARPKPETDMQADIEQSRRDRITGWLTRSGSGVDPLTGLPLSTVNRYGATEALAQATEPERQCAAFLASRFVE